MSYTLIRIQSLTKLSAPGPCADSEGGCETVTRRRRRDIHSGWQGGACGGGDGVCRRRRKGAVTESMRRRARPSARPLSPTTAIMCLCRSESRHRRYQGEGPGGRGAAGASQARRVADCMRRDRGGWAGESQWELQLQVLYTDVWAGRLLAPSLERISSSS